MLSKWLFFGFVLGVAIAPAGRTALGQSPAADDGSLETVLAQAGGNRAELERALASVPAPQAEGMRFLIENMPLRDLQSLTADFLLSHVQTAYDARAAARWGAQIPQDIFLNDVLPYANVNEKRDDVRNDLRAQFWPLVAELESISLAAARLNQAVFKQLGVKYSTKRRRADQGPSESMESGLASCTGLSILLIDAYRACGIPARFVGTPLWSDGSGNHSWVEVWDAGWHFTGAAEPTGDELDKAWFVARAGTAQVGDPRHGIFAVSFKKTPLAFPLVWSQAESQVSAVEVTERYVQSQKPAAEGTLLLQFRTLQPSSPDRCRANLTVRDAEGKVVFSGQTRDESFDANDHLTAKLKPGKYKIEWESAAGIVQQAVEAKQQNQLVTLQPSQDDPLVALTAYLNSSPRAIETIAEQAFASEPLSKAACQQAAELLVAAHQKLLSETRRQEHRDQCIVLGDRQLKYATTTFGEKPESGHSLVISMHGGGGAPTKVNDRQWENQKSLYQLEEGIYVAPRAPTDSWNMWHQAHIDPLFTRLIGNMIAFEGVDSNRVYLTGYSAGGDGVYQLAPRMADQLAAAAMMAGHPNETKPDGLRNLPFTLHVGAEDAAYDRNRIAQEWLEMLAELQAKDAGGYEHWAKVHAGKPHWMDGDDAEGIAWMQQFTRNLTPSKIVWLQDDVRHSRFYWLAVDSEQAQAGDRIVAHRDGNHIRFEEPLSKPVACLLRDDMLDLDQAVTIDVGERRVFEGRVTRTVANLAKTLLDRDDPQAMFSGRIAVAAE